MTRRDYRIPRPSADTEESALFWAVAVPLWPDASTKTTAAEAARYAAATPGQRAVSLTMRFAREVDNGGAEQFLENSGGAHATLVLDSFLLLGDADRAAALDAAVRAVFPAGLPSDQRERRVAVRALAREWRREHLDPLTDRLLDEQAPYPAWQSYIDAHPEEFFRD